MITISVCMIVKNEERILARCLDSIRAIADEIVIVDTGSSDRTKEIAAEYTDKIYDFQWVDDFSVARNFAFSKCSCDYIYSADADEIVDAENLKRFSRLKACMDTRVEIVQFIYDNPEEVNMAYNELQELRPKLFKRLREFRWIDPIHETVATEPLVFDSDIIILHRPEKNHSGRDFQAFLRLLRKEGTMSDRLFSMYAKELFFSGERKDFEEAVSWFESRSLETDTFEGLEALCVVLRTAYLCNDEEKLIKLEGIYRELTYKPAEMAYIMGLYYEQKGKNDTAHQYFEESKALENFVCVNFRAE